MPTVNISTRFAALASTLVVVSALTIGAILFSANSRILVANAEAELAFSMRQASADLRDSVKSAQTRVAFLSAMPQVRELADGNYVPERGHQLKHELTEIFASLAMSAREVMQVRLIGAAEDGRELVRIDHSANIISRVEPAGMRQVGDQPYLANTLEAAPGAILLSDIRPDHGRGQVDAPPIPVLTVSTPVYTSSGEIFGLVAIDINIGEVFATMSNRFPPEVSFYFMDASGDYLLHPEREETPHPDQGLPTNLVDEFPSLATFIRGNEAGDAFVQSAGEKSADIIHLSHEILEATQQQLHFFAAAMLPESAALVAGHERQIQIGMLTLLLAGIGALTAITTSNWLVRPLHNLSKAAARLAEGEDIDNLDIAADRRDEVGVLARGFMVMAQKLRDRQIGLEERQERIRAILDAASTPIITIDREGVIQSINAATTALFGFGRSELIGANVAMLMNTKDAMRLHRRMVRMRRNGRIRILDSGTEIEARAKDGSPIPVHLSVSPVRLSNRLLYTGVMTDLREQKKINQLKDDFVSTVSHELRTPLTSIKGSLALLKANMFGELPEQVVRMIDIAHTNAERLTNLVNDILDIEKIEAGKLSFHVEPLELGGFLRRTVDANMGLAQSAGVSLRLAHCPKRMMLDADPDRLVQVVTNLISNAIKYTPMAGEVTVSARADKQSVRIAIADQGPGVPPEFQDKIFTKFAQADSSNTRASGGTGLGLAISKAIVEAHGGEIGFRSVTGKGSTFHIELPRHQQQPSNEDVGGEAGIAGAA